MRTIVEVENIRCGGCANSILKGLSSIQGIFSADADFHTGIVTVEHTEEVTPEMIVEKLSQMGFTPKSKLK